MLCPHSISMHPGTRVTKLTSDAIEIWLPIRAHTTAERLTQQARRVSCLGGRVRALVLSRLILRWLGATDLCLRKGHDGGGGGESEDDGEFHFELIGCWLFGLICAVVVGESE
jgi:hypothetical protein